MISIVHLRKYLEFKCIHAVDKFDELLLVMCDFLLCALLVGSAEGSAKESGIADNASLVLNVAAKRLVLSTEIFLDGKIPKSTRGLAVIAHKLLNLVVVKLGEAEESVIHRAKLKNGMAYAKSIKVDEQRLTVLNHNIVGVVITVQEGVLFRKCAKQ